MGAAKELLTERVKKTFSLLFPFLRFISFSFWCSFSIVVFGFSGLIFVFLFFRFYFAVDYFFMCDYLVIFN